VNDTLGETILSSVDARRRMMVKETA